jgi:hypothetical protein
VGRLKHKAVSAGQVHDELTGTISQKAMKSARQFTRIVEIRRGDQIIKPGTKLPRGRGAEGARGEYVVMAQLLQFFRRE